MKKQELLLKKKIVILGFGLEGQSVLSFLLREKFTGMIVVADQKKQSLTHSENVTSIFGKDYLRVLEDETIDLVIKSPGVFPYQHEIIAAKKRGVNFTTSTNIFMANVRGCIIGVTGSKGKSTTATLIDNVLRASSYEVYLCGNIGKPALDVLPCDSLHAVFVYEMSSYQLDDLPQSYAPDYAIITSFFPDHIPYHETLESYFMAKMHIVGRNNNNVIFNNKFLKISEYIKNYQNNLNQNRAHVVFSEQKIIPYNDGKNYYDQEYFYINNKPTIPVSCIQLIGSHNRDNILAVLVVADLFSVSFDIQKKVISDFTGLPHRLHIVCDYNNVVYINDSACIAPESTLAAISAVEEAGYTVGSIILGGLDRGYDFTLLVQKIRDTKISSIAFLGETGKRILPLLDGYKKTAYFTDMESCVQWCYNNTPENTVCLLSPGSPSFGDFKDFFDRGNQFERSVCNLANMPLV